jgi:hypothetical protein
MTLPLDLLVCQFRIAPKRLPQVKRTRCSRQNDQACEVILDELAHDGIVRKADVLRSLMTISYRRC